MRIHKRVSYSVFVFLSSTSSGLKKDPLFLEMRFTDSHAHAVQSVLSQATEKCHSSLKAVSPTTGIRYIFIQLVKTGGYQL